MPKYTSTAIANEFLKLPGAKGHLTQMQLQKLAYIAHGWNLAINNEPLVFDSVDAWDYGPVFPWLYRHTRYFGSKSIDRLIYPADNDEVMFFLAKDADRGTPFSAPLEEGERGVIDHVWRRYGRYSASALSAATHKRGTPWYRTYFEKGKNSPISNDLIKAHYLKLAEAADGGEEGQVAPDA